MHQYHVKSLKNMVRGSYIKNREINTVCSSPLFGNPAVVSTTTPAIYQHDDGDYQINLRPFLYGWFTTKKQAVRIRGKGCAVY